MVASSGSSIHVYLTIVCHHAIFHLALTYKHIRGQDRYACSIPVCSLVMKSEVSPFSSLCLYAYVHVHVRNPLARVDSISSLNLASNVMLEQLVVLRTLPDQAA